MNTKQWGRSAVVMIAALGIALGAGVAHARLVPVMHEIETLEYEIGAVMDAAPATVTMRIDRTSGEVQIAVLQNGALIGMREGKRNGEGAPGQVAENHSGTTAYTREYGAAGVATKHCTDAQCTEAVIERANRIAVGATLNGVMDRYRDAGAAVRMCLDNTSSEALHIGVIPVGADRHCAWTPASLASHPAQGRWYAHDAQGRYLVEVAHIAPSWERAPK